MFVKVRTIDGKLEQCFEISKLMTIKDFKVSILFNNKFYFNHMTNNIKQ